HSSLLLSPPSLHDDLPIWTHSRTVGVEDPGNARIHLVIPPVGHGYCFGKPLRFIVDTARADRIDITPIGLRLWIHQRIAVYFRRDRKSTRLNSSHVSISYV